jgi:hypothetical protein
LYDLVGILPGTHRSLTTGPVVLTVHSLRCDLLLQIRRYSPAELHAPFSALMPFSRRAKILTVLN